MTEPTGYSYTRFSTPEQAKGDSKRRQDQAAEEFCRRHKLILDTTFNLHDAGVSAFKGDHRLNPKHALARFLDAVRSGRIVKGSWLIVENLDRLSREDELKAVRLFMDILDLDIVIATTNP